MEPNLNQEASEKNIVLAKTNSFTTVTPLSKYLAMALFIILPFLGGYIGYVYAPEKLVEVEKIVEIEKSLSSAEKVVIDTPDIPANTEGLYMHQISQDKTTPAVEIYYVTDSRVQFIGKVLNCNQNESVNIIELKERENQLSLLSGTSGDDLQVVDGLTCYFAGGGDEFVVVKNVETMSVSVYHRLLDEIVGTSEWGRVLTIDEAGGTSYAWPIEYLHLLEKQNVEQSIIESYRSKINVLY